MPFHLGGHKPKPTARVTFPAKRRLGIGALGVVSICAGAFTLLYDPRVLVWAATTVSLGGVIVLVSLIPGIWLEKLETVIATCSRARRGPAGIR